MIQTVCLHCLDRVFISQYVYIPCACEHRPISDYLRVHCVKKWTKV